jgi:Do/DeqQ family serine protease
VAAVVGQLPAFRSDEQPSSRVIESIQVGNPDVEYPTSVSQAVSLNTVFKDVAKSVRPAVVSVHSIGQNDEFARFHPRLGRQYRGSTGSGVIISNAGYVATNYHVVADASSILIVLLDKREFEGEVVGVDPTTDLAVVKIEAKDELPVVSLGNSDDSEVGDWVVAIGNPFRLTSTVTAGIISALGRQVNIIDDVFRVEDFIQTDAAINPGNSGGALVNLAGQLIGINTAIATQDGAYEGYGFAVPVNLVTHVVSDLIAYGEVKRAYLGIVMGEMDAELAESVGLDAISGVLVRQVVEGGAAERYGLRSGDIILSMDGESIIATNELQSRIATKRPGDVIELGVWRDSEEMPLTVTLVDREDASMKRWFAELTSPDEPSDGGEAPEVLEAADWGLSFRALSIEEYMAFSVRGGAYVGAVAEDGPAKTNGVPTDVVITEIDGEQVQSPEDAIYQLDLALAEERASVIIRVERRDGLASFYEVDAPDLD